MSKPAEVSWNALSLIGSPAIDGLLKSWIARPRPELVPHLLQVTNASLPSGHAMISSAVYLTLALMLAEGIEADGWRGRAGRVAVVAFFSGLAVLIGMSRVYLGVHWPSDVLAGWCFGTAWALVVWVGIGGGAGDQISSPDGSAASSYTVQSSAPQCERKTVAFAPLLRSPNNFIEPMSSSFCFPCYGRALDMA